MKPFKPITSIVAPARICRVTRDTAFHQGLTDLPSAKLCIGISDGLTNNMNLCVCAKSTKVLNVAKFSSNIAHITSLNILQTTSVDRSHRPS